MTEWPAPLNPGEAFMSAVSRGDYYGAKAMLKGNILLAKYECAAKRCFRATVVCLSSRLR